MIKKAGLKLGLCFIIGLPGDSYEKTLQSIRMVHELDADFVFWNMLIPYEGSPARHWYEEHGKVFDLKDITPNIGAKRLQCDTIVCSTDDFPVEERLKTRVKAVLETGAYSFFEEGITPVLKYVARYGFWPEFFRSLIYKSKRYIKFGVRRLQKWGQPPFNFFDL
jgi:hypothetical protein